MPSTEGGAASFLKCLTDFSVNFYCNTVTSDEYKNYKNYVLSPFAVHSAMSLIFWGCRGQCAKELAKALRLEVTDRKIVASHYQHLIRNLWNASDSQFKSAVEILLREPYDLDKEFEDVAFDQFLAWAGNIDFFYDARAADDINAWVENYTGGNIRNIIDPESIWIDSEIVIVIGNYFSARWDSQLANIELSRHYFQPPQAERFLTEMICVNGLFKYGKIEELNAEVLELPFESNVLSLLVIVPSQTEEGIRTLEEQLKSHHLLDLKNNMAEKHLDIRLPTFKIEFNSNILPTLEKEEIGMHCVASEYADFAYLLDMPEALRISLIKHKIIIEVSDRCTDANPTQSTEQSRLDTSTNVVDPFYADRPFIFVVRWNKFNIPIVMGTLRSPDLVTPPAPPVIH